MTNYYSVFSKKGNVTVGENETLFVPGNKRPDGNSGVILLHGAGSTYDMYSEAMRWASSELAAQIALAGIPCLSIHMSGNSFANDVAMLAVDNGITYLSAQTGTNPIKAHVLGVSMGGGTATRYGITNPTKTSSIVGLIPMANISRLYENNTLGLRADIGTAWGVTYPTALPPEADLIGQAPTIASAGIPSLYYYDDTDTAILPQDVIDLATAAGSTAIEIDPEDLGHSEGSVKAIINSGAGMASGIIEFLLENGA